MACMRFVWFLTLVTKMLTQGAAHPRSSDQSSFNQLEAYRYLKNRSVSDDRDVQAKSLLMSSSVAHDYPTQENVIPIHTECPDMCRCVEIDTAHHLSVDCSSRGLRSIPSLPPQAVLVNLQDNVIDRITGLDWSRARDLEDINLSGNNMTVLGNCTFKHQKFLLKLNISRCGIQTIGNRAFQPLENLKHLDLSYNKITEITPYIFTATTSLQYADLSHNLMSHITDKTFSGLESLEYLSLAWNNLRYTNESFRKDAFVGLGSLQTLLLHGNHIHDVPCEYPDVALSRLKNVRHIRLDGCSVPLGEGFRNLTELSVLDFSGTQEAYDPFCQLGSVPVDMFKNVLSRQKLYLNMSNCNINYLPQEVFDAIPNVVELNFENNFRLGLSGFQVASKGLRYSNITFLNIIHLTQSRFSDIVLSNDFLKYLQHTNLKSLKLDRNRITKVTPGFMALIPNSLEYISLKSNYLIDATLLVALPFLTNLKYFDVSYQLNFHTEDNLEMKKSLPAALQGERTRFNEKCPITGSQSPFMLSGNKENGRIDLPVKNITFVLPKNLEVILLNNIKLGYSAPPVTFFNNDVLRFANLSSMMSRCWEGPFKGVPALRYLDLSNNDCQKVQPYFFQYANNVTSLMLQKNFLGQSLADDSKGDIFSNCFSLEDLDLSFNSIRTLSYNVFINSRNLKWLNLSYNDMSSWTVNSNFFKRFEILDLSYNLLPGLSDQNCKSFQKMLSTNERFHLRLQGNPLQATCAYKSFIRLLVRKPSMVFEVGSLVFILDNGSVLSYNETIDYLPTLERNCLTAEIYQYVLISFFFVLGIVLMSAMFYYKRWRLMYLYYIGKRRLHYRDTPLTYAPIAQVYVTYEQEPQWLHFVQRVFLPRLRAHNITYITAENDFDGGDLMAHTAAAIVGTRKTVVLLSRDIFEDTVREREIHLAMVHEITTRSEFIVPVAVEDIDLEHDMRPPEIQIFLQNQLQRILHYSDTEQFWNTLYQKLTDE